MSSLSSDAIGQQSEDTAISWKGAVPFISVHLMCFWAFQTGVTWEWVALAIGSYYLRMFAITAGYHRYFSHRSYKTSRVFQFVLAFLAMTSAQKGVLWWAAHHRHHHKHSDRVEDRHSPLQRGFWYSHVGWLLSDEYVKTDFGTGCLKITPGHDPNDFEIGRRQDLGVGVTEEGDLAERHAHEHPLLLRPPARRRPRCRRSPR